MIETGERLARSAGLVSTLLRGLNNRTITRARSTRAVLEAPVEGLALARRMGLRYWTFGFAVSIGYTSFRRRMGASVTVLAEALADTRSPRIGSRSSPTPCSCPRSAARR